MRNNELRVLPLEMGKWAKLKRVLAGGNGILELPAEVTGLEMSVSKIYIKIRQRWSMSDIRISTIKKNAV